MKKNIKYLCFNMYVCCPCGLHCKIVKLLEVVSRNIYVFALRDRVGLYASGKHLQLFRCKSKKTCARGHSYANQRLAATTT